MDLSHSFDTRTEFAFVHEVTHADTDAVHLVAIARTDTATRSTDSSLAGLLFLGLVQGRVVREHDVCVVSDEQATFRIDALRVEVSNFVQSLDRIEHDAVTDDANLVRVHNARGNKVEDELLVANFHSVTGVSAALETHDNICIER